MAKSYVSKSFCLLDSLYMHLTPWGLRLGGGGGGRHSPIQAVQVCEMSKGLVFELFWSERGYKF